ncbi:hypothetical protein [Rhodopseudomonas sp. RCAM05734]
MLSAIQLIRLVSIPATMALFMVAAQLSANLTLRSAEPLIVVSSR